MSHSKPELHGRYRSPSFEHARVGEAMRIGTLNCTPEASLRSVARTMATHHVHSVIVNDPDEGGAWGLLSDLDLVAAARAGSIDDLTAGEACASEVLTISSDDTLEHAAQLLGEHACAHAIVVAAGTRAPIGMLSTLDIAGTLVEGGD